MQNFFYYSKKSHFFYKTLKGLLELFTKNIFSFRAIPHKITYSLNSFVEIILKNALKYMIKGKRKFLIIEDLQNTFSEIKEIQFTIFKKIIYNKPIKNLNFISKIFKKKKILKKKNSNFKKNKFFLIQYWHYVIKKEKSKKKSNYKKQIITNLKIFKKKFLNKNLFSVSLSLLTSKQKLFFRYLISILEKEEKNEDDINEEEACLECLSENRGLFPLIPYIFIYLNNLVLRENDSILKVYLGVKMIKALFLNDYLKLEPFVQQILPILLHCIISSFSEKIALNEILSFKLYIANLIGFIVNRFQKNYINIKSKLTFFFLKYLFSDKKNILQIYGALIGLTGLGTKTIELYAIPNFPLISSYFQIKIKKKNVNFKEILILKNLINFIIIMTTTYLIDKNIDFFWRDISEFHEKNSIEKVFKFLPKLKKIKNYIDVFLKNEKNLEKNEQNEF